MFQLFRLAGQSDSIVLARKARDDEDKWQAARSWLGGLPTIDPGNWPRSNETGLPMHHLAQIDLAELPRGRKLPMLPKSGSLSFFADTQVEDDDLEVAVIFTSGRQQGALAEPPSDCTALGGNQWYYERFNHGYADQVEAPRVCRRWPIEFLHATLGDDAEAFDESYNGEMDRLVGPAPKGLHLFEHGQWRDLATGVFPWAVVQRITNDVRYAMSEHNDGRAFKPYPWVTDTPEAHEAKWQARDSELSGARAFIRRWSAELQGRDLFDPLGEVGAIFEQDVLEVYRTVSLRFGGGTSPIRDAASEVYRDMLVGPRDVFERIPGDIRNYLMHDRRRSGWGETMHQMFGVGPHVQYDPDEFDGSEVLLLSIQSDDMMSWCWGDVGQISFRISSFDLRLRRWHKAWGLFEGH